MEGTRSRYCPACRAVTVHRTDRRLDRARKTLLLAVALLTAGLYAFAWARLEAREVRLEGAAALVYFSLPGLLGGLLAGLVTRNRPVRLTCSACGRVAWSRSAPAAPPRP